MLCYRDTTYCVQWELCTKGDGCEYALTDNVRKEAITCNLPISQVDRRYCFRPRSRSIERRLKIQE